MAQIKPMMKMNKTLIAKVEDAPDPQRHHGEAVPLQRVCEPLITRQRPDKRRRWCIISLSASGGLSRGVKKWDFIKNVYLTYRRVMKIHPSLPNAY